MRHLSILFAAFLVVFGVASVNAAVLHAGPMAQALMQSDDPDVLPEGAEAAAGETEAAGEEDAQAVEGEKKKPVEGAEGAEGEEEEPDC